MTNPSGSERQGEATKLDNLLPTKQQLSTAFTEEPPSLLWTLQDIAAARSGMIRRFIKKGWKLVENGRLWNGKSGRQKVEAMPTALMDHKSGRIDFNPRIDATAIRMGATFISGNRYALGEHVMDRNGMFKDPNDCPECGGTPFRVRIQNPNPWAKPWEQSFTYCRRCVTPQMIDDHGRRLAATPQARRR